MQTIFRLGISAFCMLWLSSCEGQPLTYQFLMTHPERLEQEAARCEAIQSSSCDIVKQAATDFLELEIKRRNSPEEFGQQIMQEELQMANKLEMLQQAKNSREAQAAYEEQRDKVQRLLAVVAATSPVG